MARVRIVPHGRGSWLRTLCWLVLLRLTRMLGRRGYYRICAWADRLGDRVRVRVAPDTWIEVPLGDIYWNTLLERPYEPEVATALDRHATATGCFLDLGANIGFWSLQARNRFHTVVAVEASPETFARLEANCRLNDARFPRLQAAVWDRSGESLTIHQHAVHHAAASVVGALGEVAEAGGWHDATVSTVGLSDLLETYAPDPHTAVVIKLDVEGAEIRVLDGARAALARRPVVLLYEDHGSDPTCAVTQHLLDADWQIQDARSGRTLQLEEVRASKRDPHVGYNFVAKNQRAVNHTPEPG